jgi:hypothetical protein
MKGALTRNRLKVFRIPFYTQIMTRLRAPGTVTILFLFVFHIYAWSRVYTVAQRVTCQAGTLEGTELLMGWTAAMLASYVAMTVYSRRSWNRK